MDRNQILKEILADPELMEKYGIKGNELQNLKVSAPYYKKIVEVLAVMINENDNHLSPQRIYTKIKNTHNIG